MAHASPTIRYQPASQRSQRLREIAQDLQIVSHENLAPLSSPGRPPSFRIPDDERKADAYLGQLRIEEAQNQPQPKGLKRAFTTNKRQGPYNYQEIYAALARVIEDDGQVGVAEVLLNRLRGVGGDPNLARRASTSVLKKITNGETQGQRGRLLQSATEKCRHDLVQILAPYIDSASLDESLFIALERKRLGIVETLLQHGANPANCKAQFERAARGGDAEADMLQLLLRSPKQIPLQFIIDSLLLATASGSLRAVLLLIRAGADGDHDGASALMHAVETGRDDLAMAILTGKKIPSPASLDRAIGAIFSAATTNLHDKLLLVEALLCGGPHGNAINEGLFKATIFANVEMMQLLLEYGVDINYNNASAVCHAVQRNRTDLVEILLQNQRLNPDMASEAVGRIPRKAPPTVKVGILSKLLLHGASGPHCNQLLVAAAENDDLETAGLLLSYGKDHNSAPPATVEYNGARCLQVAVSRNNHEMVNLLTREGQPSKFSLSRVFPMVSRVNDKSHFMMVQSLLNGGAQGEEVDALLCTAVTGQQRSKALAKLLVQHGANVNRQTLLKITSQGDLDMLNILLLGNPSVPSCCAAITEAMKISKKDIRFKAIQPLLPHAVQAGAEDTAIAQAVIDVLEGSPEDLKLLHLLCQEGKAKINFRNGQAVALAAKNANPQALDIVLQSSGGWPTADTVARCLICVMELPLTNTHRCRKVEALLRKAKPQDAMNRALIDEIKLVRTLKADISVVETLLAAGADVNAEEGAPVCYAVKDSTILDLLLTKRPTPYSLSKAFPLAVTLPEPERSNLCEKLLKAGAVGDEINKALLNATKEGHTALHFMRLLLPQADVNYSAGRILRIAVRQAFAEGIDLLLTQRPLMPTVETKILSFQEAMKIKGKRDRYIIVQKLLKTGIKGQVLADALITAVNYADIPLAELLLKAGASLEYNGGQAVVSATSSGDQEMLKLLVGGTHTVKPTLSVLTTGFGGAMALKERDKISYISIFKILLEVGLRGEAVDAALVEAVKEGDNNVALVELTYTNGASIEYQEGEAIDIATRLASIETLSLLLSTPPSQSTLKRAYRSSLELAKDQRSTIIKLLMKAGKSVDKHVTNTLLHATQEKPADHELIRTLLSFEVFDEGQSMSCAASALDLETLKLLLESPKASNFTSLAFKDAMGNGVPWASQRGLSIMELLLEHGAAGEAVGQALLDAVERCQDSVNCLAKDFLNLLLRLNPDVNHQKGIVLQRAAQHGNLDFMKKLIPSATSETKAMAFPYIFNSTTDEALILQMIEFFTDSIDEKTRLDVAFEHPNPALKPVLFTALENFPRKTKILEALLHAGFSPNQWHNIDTEFGMEPLTVLCWALYQPEKRISSANIALLIDAGANVNGTSRSSITPLMLSITNQRPDILEKLISKGAKVNIQDVSGTTPLALASQVGNASVMEHLLNAGAEVDDGSLHDAARELRIDAMRVLLRFGHDPDFPSDRHDGRSALAELCYKAVDNGPNPDLEEAILCLIAAKADFRLSCTGGKTIFHFALDSSDPVTILKVLLKTLWKMVNEDCYLYTDGEYTYSLTKYVEKGLCLCPQSQNQEILYLLRKSRAKDRFWANSTDVIQPADYCGAPEHIEEEVIRQRARAKREAEMREDMALQLEMKQKLAIEEDNILRARTEHEIRLEFEKARAQELILNNRSDQQLRLESRAEQERQRLSRLRYADELGHQKAVGAAQVSTQRELQQARIESARTEQMLQIEFEEAKNSKINEGIRARLAIEGSAIEDQDRVFKIQHERQMARMRTQKALVESVKEVSDNLKNAGANQRQIGYIMGEVQGA